LAILALIVAIVAVVLAGISLAMRGGTRPVA
jgi:hypothetical protein